MDSKIQTARDLLARHGALASIEGAALWCAEADATVAYLAAEASAARSRIVDLASQAQMQRREAKTKSFFGRFFKSADEKITQAEDGQLKNVIAQCHSLTEHLQERVDATPISREQQVQLLKELKTAKKEIQLRKKEHNAEMKSIRTVARQKSVNAASPLTTLFGGQKYTAIQRRNIRYSKESALAPLEDAQATLERQTLALENAILRLESFR